MSVKLRGIQFRVLALLLGLVGCELVLQVGSVLLASNPDAGFSKSALRSESRPFTILSVGDSNTYGVFVEPNETFPARLESELEKRLGEPIESVVLATPGFNTAHMRHRVEAVLDEHHPDLVLLLGGANNNWNPQETAHWGSPGYWDRAERLLSKLRLYKLFRLVMEAERAPPDPTRTSEYDGTMDERFLFRVTKEDASAIFAMAREHGAIPVGHSYFAFFGYYPLLSSALDEAATEQGGLFVDHTRAIQNALKTIPREKFYFPDSHLRAPGYEVVAKNLADHLAPLIRQARENASLPQDTRE